MAAPLQRRRRGLLAAATAAVATVPLLIAVPGTAHAATTCKANGPTYTVNTAGALQTYRMQTPLTGSFYSGPTSIGTGWQTYGRVIAGPGGDFYAAKPSGLFYAHHNGTVWDVQPKQISNSFGYLANTADRDQASVDRLGRFWVVDNAGILRAYKYNRTTDTWDNAGRSLAHDSGWNRYNLITAADAGVIYGRAASDGKLYRSRFDHTSQRWIERHVLVSGSDWRQFKSISSNGGDTLVATQSTTGEAFYYRFDEATDTWPVNRYEAGSSGWDNFREVAAAPDNCAIGGSFTPANPVLTQESHTPTAVTQVTGGSLEFAYTDNIGRLVHGRMPDPSDVNNVSWTTVSGSEAFTGRPALGEHADGRVSLTGHNISSSVWQRNQVAKSSADWGAWTNQAGAMKYHPITAKTPSGLLTQFAADASGKPWYRILTAANGEFRGWMPLAGTGFADSFTAVTVRNGIQLFGRNASGVLSTALFADDGTLSAWTPIGAQAIGGTPSVIVYPGFRLRIFAKDGNGKIVTTSQSTEGGPYGTWSQVGDLTAAGSPSAVISPSTGLTEVVARGTDGFIHDIGETTQGSGTWRPWRSGSHATATDPTTVTYTNSTGPTWAYVFRTADNQTWIYATSSMTTGARKAAGAGEAPVFEGRRLAGPK